MDSDFIEFINQNWNDKFKVGITASTIPSPSSQTAQQNAIAVQQFQQQMHQQSSAKPSNCCIDITAYDDFSGPSSTNFARSFLNDLNGLQQQCQEPQQDQQQSHQMSPPLAREQNLEPDFDIRLAFMQQQLQQQQQRQALPESHQQHTSSQLPLPNISPTMPSTTLSASSTSSTSPASTSQQRPTTAINTTTYPKLIDIKDFKGNVCITRLPTKSCANNFRNLATQSYPHHIAGSSPPPPSPRISVLPQFTPQLQCRSNLHSGASINSLAYMQKNDESGGDSISMRSNCDLSSRISGSSTGVDSENSSKDCSFRDVERGNEIVDSTTPPPSMQCTSSSSTIVAHVVSTGEHDKKAANSIRGTFSKCKPFVSKSSRHFIPTHVPQRLSSDSRALSIDTKNRNELRGTKSIQDMTKP